MAAPSLFQAGAQTGVSQPPTPEARPLPVIVNNYHGAACSSVGFPTPSGVKAARWLRM